MILISKCATFSESINLLHTKGTHIMFFSSKRMSDYNKCFVLNINTDI